jgi:hypothetical protein
MHGGRGAVVVHCTNMPNSGARVGPRLLCMLLQAIVSLFATVIATHTRLQHARSGAIDGPKLALPTGTGNHRVFVWCGGSTTLKGREG